MGRGAWVYPLYLAIAAGAGALVALVVAVLTARTGRRHDLASVTMLDQYCRRAWIATVAALCVLATTHTTTARGLTYGTGWRRAAVIAVIAVVCWLISRLLVVVEKLLLARLPVDVEDNRRARRARTQITLVRRLISAVVVVLGVSASLMTFPDLRTFGTSLLASAGLAGIIAGLAAQTTLANLFAGLQLAFTDAVRIDDVVVVEQEWGWIEEITLTYVVLHVWDERRIVLPTSYFTSTPFQNWTRTESRLLGAVELRLDYATPLEPLRQHAKDFIAGHKLWDGRDWVLQVIDTTDSAMVVRVLASSDDAPSSWDLRCDIREALITYLQENHPQSLPVVRVLPAVAAPESSVRAGGAGVGPGQQEHADRSE
jgi:small-conductance mechanosensitive channel